MALDIYSVAFNKFHNMCQHERSLFCIRCKNTNESKAYKLKARILIQVWKGLKFLGSKIYTNLPDMNY